jgi:hypothetical protein
MEGVCEDKGYLSCAQKRQSHRSELIVGVGLRTTTGDLEALPYDEPVFCFLCE